MTNGKIGEGGCQRSPRNFKVTLLQRWLNMAWQGRWIVIRHHRKMWVGVVPLLYEEMAFTIGVAIYYILLGTIWFGMGCLFATLTLGGWFINNVFLPIRAGRAFAFRQRHEQRIRWCIWGYERRNGQKNERKKKELRKRKGIVRDKE